MTSLKPSQQSFDNRDKKWIDRIARSLGGLINFSSTKANVGTFIDGKPTAIITISTGALPNTTTKTVAHGLTFSDIIKVDGFATDGSTWIPLPNIDTSSLATIEVFVGTTNISLVSVSNMSSYTKSYITLMYTV